MVDWKTYENKLCYINFKVKMIVQNNEN